MEIPIRGIGNNAYARLKNYFTRRNFSMAFSVFTFFFTGGLKITDSPSSLSNVASFCWLTLWIMRLLFELWLHMFLYIVCGLISSWKKQCYKHAPFEQQPQSICGVRKPALDLKKIKNTHNILILFELGKTASTTISTANQNRDFPWK